MKYLDLVKLVVDRPQYEKENVHKGMCGVIMSERSINGEWQVIFSDAATGKDIADLGIKEKDLVVLLHCDD